MSEQWTSCLQKRTTALYRYTRAMDCQDAETISKVLSQAEHDPVLERMLLEVNEGYQIEDRTVAHSYDVEAVQHMLREMMPTLLTTPDALQQNQPIRFTPTSGTPSTPKSQQKENEIQRPGRLFIKKWLRSRYSWLAIAAVFMVILISLPTTNVLADQFLALFRVQQFQPVSIDSQQSVETLLTTLQNIGDIQAQQRSSSSNQQNLTQAQAEKILGYHVLLPSHLPAGVSTTQNIAVVGGDQVTYTFNAAKAKTYLAKNGQSSVAIPTNLDGASYTITVAPSVNVSYSSCPQNKEGCKQDKTFFVHEVADPSFQGNGNASITQLRDFLLSLPNLSPSARELLKHLDEKTGTIPVPIPPQASAEQVTLRGTSGLLLKSNNMSAAIWETQGIVYTLVLGTGDRTQLLDAVNSLA
ncbi:MAG: hypothetical protein H0U76_17595 [Ktedonobacteraceae bacterium]|nr:hypothetical protein [Ktedonobacteraceae bacterium]